VALEDLWPSVPGGPTPCSTNRPCRKPCSGPALQRRPPRTRRRDLVGDPPKPPAGGGRLAGIAATMPSATHRPHKTRFRSPPSTKYMAPLHGSRRNPCHKGSLEAVCHAAGAAGSLRRGESHSNVPPVEGPSTSRHGRGGALRVWLRQWAPPRPNETKPGSSPRPPEGFRLLGLQGMLDSRPVLRRSGPWRPVIRAGITCDDDHRRPHPGHGLANRCRRFRPFPARVMRLWGWKGKIWRP